MVWINRRLAGQALASSLLRHVDDWLLSGSLVVALPRGGVEVGVEVALGLQLPLTTWSVRKLSLPDAPEVAVGAIAPGGLSLWTVDGKRLPPTTRAAILARAQRELQRRQNLYHDAAPGDLTGRGLILVDDGIATGMTILAALHSLLEHNPRSLILAVPVVDRSLVSLISGLCTHFLALDIVTDLQAVGSYYRDFPPVSDARVLELLSMAR